MKPIIYSDIIQGSAEWLQIRSGKVTASELDNLISPKKMEIRKGEMPATYLAKKVAETIYKGPLPEEEYSGWDTERGQMLEDEARKFYCFNFDHEKLKDAGFVLHPDGRFGGSPDALIGDSSGLEIKAPTMKTHTKYLIAGELPDDYVMQVQGLMYATGRASWQFLSYCRKFPPFLITVQRDDKAQAVIAEALDGFYDKMDAALAKLKGPQNV